MLKKNKMAIILTLLFSLSVGTVKAESELWNRTKNFFATIMAFFVSSEEQQGGSGSGENNSGNIQLPPVPPAPPKNILPVAVEVDSSQPRLEDEYVKEFVSGLDDVNSLEFATNQHGRVFGFVRWLGNSIKRLFVGGYEDEIVQLQNRVTTLEEARTELANVKTTLEREKRDLGSNEVRVKQRLEDVDQRVDLLKRHKDLLDQKINELLQLCRTLKERGVRGRRNRFNQVRENLLQHRQQLEERLDASLNELEAANRQVDGKEQEVLDLRGEVETLIREKNENEKNEILTDLDRQLKQKEERIETLAKELVVSQRENRKGMLKSINELQQKDGEISRLGDLLFGLTKKNEELTKTLEEKDQRVKDVVQKVEQYEFKLKELEELQKEKERELETHKEENRKLSVVLREKDSINENLIKNQEELSEKIEEMEGDKVSLDQKQGQMKLILEKYKRELEKFQEEKKEEVEVYQQEDQKKYDEMQRQILQQELKLQELVRLQEEKEQELETHKEKNRQLSVVLQEKDLVNENLIKTQEKLSKTIDKIEVEKEALKSEKKKNEALLTQYEREIGGFKGSDSLKFEGFDELVDEFTPQSRTPGASNQSSGSEISDQEDESQGLHLVLPREKKRRKKRYSASPRLTNNEDARKRIVIAENTKMLKIRSSEDVLQHVNDQSIGRNDSSDSLSDASSLDDENGYIPNEQRGDNEKRPLVPEVLSQDDNVVQKTEKKKTDEIENLQADQKDLQKLKNETSGFVRNDDMPYESNEEDYDHDGSENYKEEVLHYSDNEENQYYDLGSKLRSNVHAKKKRRVRKKSKERKRRRKKQTLQKTPKVKDQKDSFEDNIVKSEDVILNATKKSIIMGKNESSDSFSDTSSEDKNAVNLIQPVSQSVTPVVQVVPQVTVPGTSLLNILTEEDRIKKMQNPVVVQPNDEFKQKLEKKSEERNETELLIRQLMKKNKALEGKLEKKDQEGSAFVDALLLVNQRAAEGFEKLNKRAGKLKKKYAESEEYGELMRNLKKEESQKVLDLSVNDRENGKKKKEKNQDQLL